MPHFRAELARLADEQNPPLALEDAWTTYIASPNRPDTGPDTLEVYQGQFGQFIRWVKETHPGVALLRDVSQDMAEGRPSAKKRELRLGLLLVPPFGAATTGRIEGVEDRFQPRGSWARFCRN